MQDFLTFVIKHWELWLAFVVVLIYWLILETQEKQGGAAVSAQQLVHLMNRENAVIVDLRTKEAFQQGHVLGALSFPEKTILEQLNKIKKYQQKKIVLVDGNGQLAPTVVKALNKQNYAHVCYLKQGMQAWVHAKLPVEKNI